MADTTIEDLRAELDRQREAQEARHRDLLAQLTPGRPTTAADVRRTMASGYQAEADRREREAAGEGENGGDE